MYKRANISEAKNKMPCACRVPLAEYPQNAEWGPLAWDILHGLAERSGQTSNAHIQKDEARHWILLIESVEKMIPCDVCRGHYKEYLAENPVKQILDQPYEKLNPFVKTWFWRLHNDINLGNDKPVFTFDELGNRYKSIAIKQRLDQLAAPIQRAMTNNGVKLLHWKAFEREVRTLLGL